MFDIGAVVAQVVELYIFLIVGYVLLSWFPVSGLLADIHRVLGTLVEPYLGLFRRFIPPVGMLDISPIVAILVLQVLTSIVLRVL